MTVLTVLRATDVVARLHAVIDELAACDPGDLTVAEQESRLRSLGRAQARLAAIKLATLAAAHESDVASRTGAASTDQWAARATNVDPVVAHREVRLSQRLAQRSLTQVALAAGELSAEHAAIIVGADEQLPASLTAAQRRVVEEALVAKARVMPPRLLRRAARRALEALDAEPRVVDAHENELVAAEEAAARARTRLSMHENGDGTVSGHFTIPVLHGQLLGKIIASITAPRRGRLGAPNAQVGENTGLRTEPDRARGEALCELIEHLPTDHLHPRTAATVVVTIAEETLREAVAVAGLDTGESLSAGQARRLACNAALIPAVLDGASQVLDLGRASRLFTQSQRTALGLRHTTCAADGCERPYAWCELHHHNPWARGGPTDLANAIPLCHFHHQRIHDPEYRHEHKPGGVSFYRRT